MAGELRQRPSGMERRTAVSEVHISRKFLFVGRGSVGQATQSNIRVSVVGGIGALAEVYQQNITAFGQRKGKGIAANSILGKYGKMSNTSQVYCGKSFCDMGGMTLRSSRGRAASATKMVFCWTVLDEGRNEAKADFRGLEGRGKTPVF